MCGFLESRMSRKTWPPPKYDMFQEMDDTDRAELRLPFEE